MGKSNNKTTVIVQDDGSLATILPIKILLDAANNVRKLDDPNSQLLAQAVVTAVCCIVADHHEYLSDVLVEAFSHARTCPKTPQERLGKIFVIETLNKIEKEKKNQKSEPPIFLSRSRRIQESIEGNP